MSAYPEIFNHISRKKSSFLKLLQPDLFQVLKEQLQEQVQEPSTVVTGFGRHDAPPASNPDLWPFDLETGIRVASRGGGIFLPKLDTLGLWVLELFAMYATDGQRNRQTDGQTDKSNTYCPLPTVGSITSLHILLACHLETQRRTTAALYISIYLFIFNWRLSIVCIIQKTV